MSAAVYALLRHVLSQRQRNRLTEALQKARAAAAAVARIVHGSFAAADLLDHLRQRLPSEAEVLMVHSSMAHLCPMFTGTVFDLLAALTELAGNRRTLAMPTFFFGGSDNDVETHYRRSPVFDERMTPSEMGLLSEMFRRSAGVRRSLHPTHSVCARGPLAEEIVRRHHLCGNTFGDDSPFEVMSRHRTVIVGLGVHYWRVLTQVHCAEDILGERFPVPRDVRPPLPVTLIARDGTRHPYALPPPVGSGRQRRIERLAGFLPAGELDVWSFHGVPMFAVSAAVVTTALVEAAGKGNTIYQ
jgi:aminoglycoside N3'-acetyltransferase